MSQKDRDHLRRHVDSRHLLPTSMATKTRLVAWLVSNMYAVNQRKLYVTRLRRRIPVSYYFFDNCVTINHLLSNTASLFSI